MIRPQFEVVIAATASERRLIPVDTMRDLTGIPETGKGAATDTALGAMIDDALTRCARSCRLAAYRASPPTLAEETVRATWTADYWNALLVRPPEWWQRGPYTLLLPWRAPITSITVTEGETELVEDTDFRLLGAGVVERINGAWPTAGSTVIDYVAGFVPLSTDPSYDYDGETLPADLVSLIADQVRMAHSRSGIDLNLRSEDIAGVWSGSYNVPGGDSIDTSGLHRPLYDALSDYRAPPSIG